MKKKFGLLILGAILCVGFSMPAMAGEWKNDHIGWWYRNDDRSYPAYRWMLDCDGKWYCFNEAGYMLANTYSPDGYWLSASGAYDPSVPVNSAYITVTKK